MESDRGKESEVYSYPTRAHLVQWAYPLVYVLNLPTS